MMVGKLSETDHVLMDQFLAQMFEDVRSQALGRTAFVETIAFVITAVDIGQHGEAVRCFREQRKRVCGPALAVVGSTSDIL